VTSANTPDVTYTLRQAAQITHRDLGLLRRWAAKGLIATTTLPGKLGQRVVTAAEVARIDTLPRKGYVRTLRLVRTVRESDGAVTILEIPDWQKVRKTK
jgi:hypothetical protein